MLAHGVGHMTLYDYCWRDCLRFQLRMRKLEYLLADARARGAEIVFTTAPPHLRSTLRAAVKHPSVRFLNCSTGTQLSSVRSYYCRAYEGKFITGVIAGAMADNNRVGYIGSYPILGVPASINAFALSRWMFLSRPLK